MNILRLLLLVILLSVTTAYAQDAALVPPDAVVKQTITELLTTFNNDKEIVHHREKIEQLVATTILPRFDFEYLTKLTVGEKKWAAATPQDQLALVDEYRTFLAHLFTNSLAQYDNETVLFTSSEISPDETNAVVKSKLNDPVDEPEEMDFKLDKTANGWMVYNIEIGGVDLLRTYKSNFKSILENGGVTNLISELHKKNQEVKSAKK